MIKMSDYHFYHFFIFIATGFYPFFSMEKSEKIQVKIERKIRKNLQSGARNKQKKVDKNQKSETNNTYFRSKLLIYSTKIFFIFFIKKWILYCFFLYFCKKKLVVLIWRLMKQFLLIKKQNVKFTFGALLCGASFLRCGIILIVRHLRSCHTKNLRLFIHNQSIALKKLITNPQLNQYEYIHLNIYGSRAENPFPKSRRNFNKKEF